MTNNLNELTSKQIRSLIRKEMGLKQSDKEFFLWEEMKAICLRINPKSPIRFKVRAEKGIKRKIKKNECRGNDIFPKYFANWKFQTTVATHPGKQNLEAIYQAILDTEIAPIKKILKKEVKFSKPHVACETLKTLKDFNLISHVDSLTIQPDNSTVIKFK